MVKVEYAVEAVSKSMYERLFKWLVMRINRILNRGPASSSAAAHFMGILDVAGFEVFLVGNARIPEPFWACILVHGLRKSEHGQSTRIIQSSCTIQHT